MTPAAQCPIHPQHTATRTCARCGNFMCDECSLGGSELNCPRCRALSGTTFPFTRTSHDFSRLWDYAFEAWKREWAMLSVGVIIVAAALIAGGLVGNVVSSVLQAIVGKSNVAGLVAALVLGQIFVQVMQQAAVGAMQMGMMRMSFDVLEGGRADIGRMFTQLAKIPTFVAQWLMVFLMVGLPVILYFVIAFVVAIKVGNVEMPSVDFTSRSAQREWGELVFKVAPIMSLALLVIFVPLIWVSLALTFVPMEIVYGNSGAWEAITRSFALARGFRLSLFGYSFVAGLVVLVGVLACCVGVLPAAALTQLLMCALYLSVRNGSGLPAPPPQS